MSALWSPYFAAFREALTPRLPGQPDLLELAAQVMAELQTTTPWPQAALAEVYPEVSRWLPDVDNQAAAHWAVLPPNLVHYQLRLACGLEACPLRAEYDHWLARQPPFAGICGFDWHTTPYTWLDLRRGAGPFAHWENVADLSRFTHAIDSLIQQAGAQAGVGGYGEERPFYITPAYAVAGNTGPRWRSVHLGLDIWLPAGAPVFAPLHGQVVAVHDNAAERDYGPTLILRHQPTPQLAFYTLYGHLAPGVLDALATGQEVQAGELICHIGAPPRNGNWPPHLHFQVFLDPFHFQGDYPGVAFPNEQTVWLSVCPDPAPLAGLPTDPHICRPL